MSFKSDIEKWKAKALKAADAVFRGSCLTVFSAIIRRTPVRTGRLRGNWQAEINTIPTDNIDSNGGAALSRAARVTGRAKITDSVYLINNLPYAESIENGRSKQAPAGMVKITIAEWNQTVEANARKNNK